MPPSRIFSDTRLPIAFSKNTPSPRDQPPVSSPAMNEYHRLHIAGIASPRLRQVAKCLSLRASYRPQISSFAALISQTNTISLYIELSPCTRTIRYLGCLSSTLAAGCYHHQCSSSAPRTGARQGPARQISFSPSLLPPANCKKIPQPPGLGTASYIVPNPHIYIRLYG